jgi:integrase
VAEKDLLEDLTMALRIYIRKHAPGCLNRINERVTKGEIRPLSAKDLTDYRFCKCCWWISGTTDDGRPMKQQSLKAYSYSAAEQKRKEKNKPPAAAGGDQNITVEELVKRFVSNRDNGHCTDDTTGTYSLIGMRMVDYCKEHVTPKLILAKDVTQEHLLNMRTSWHRGIGIPKPLKLSTTNAHMNVVKMIFAQGVEDRKITWNPLDGVKPLNKKKQRGADADEDEEGEGKTMPLDEIGDENYRKLLAGAKDFLAGKLVVIGKKFARAKQVAVFSADPERFVLLMELMYETGLRISDTIHFKPIKMIIEDDECASYTTEQIKTGNDVTVFIPLPLAQRIAALAPLHDRGWVFYDGSGTWRDFANNTCYRLIFQLGKAVGVSGARPHRFRDSFAVNRLNELVSIEAVSTMLGHSDVETTKRYYTPWVKSRHEVLKNVWKQGRHTGPQVAAPVKVISLVPAATKRRRA